MISAKKAEEIWNKVLDHWKNKFNQEDSLDPVKLAAVRLMIFMFPHEDGNQRVVDMRTGFTHLVPLEEIILNGLHGADLHRFPIEYKPTKR
jgi:hypothetical protein